jgi:hypothetical protein
MPDHACSIRLPVFAHQQNPVVKSHSHPHSLKSINRSGCYLLLVTSGPTIRPSRRPRRITPTRAAIPVRVECQLQLRGPMHPSSTVAPPHGHYCGWGAYTRHVRCGVRGRLAIQVGLIIVVVVVVGC